MRIPELYDRGRLILSFEVFPPKTPQGWEGMYRAVGELAAYNPGFVSVTYGAGGGTRLQTLEIIAEIRRRFDLSATAHFTVIGSTIPEMHDFLDKARSAGTTNIMALRGDPPEGQARFTPVEGGLRYANELVALIHEHFPEFGVGVAGYPETHQEASCAEDDLAHLKRKVDAGAHAVYTQLFYDNADFFRFRDRCDQLGIRCPIIPGLLPILNLSQVRRITTLCGSKLPAPLVAALEQCGDDNAAQTMVGVDHCIAQCQELIDKGVPGIHYYVLNRADATRRILSAVLGSETEAPSRK